MFDKNIRLFELNQQRINQFERYIMSSDDEDEQDMISSIPLLKQMNNLWFFTLDSQGGNKNTFEQDGIQYTIDQRSYVIGFMPKVIYMKFKNNIESCENIIVNKMDIDTFEEEVELTRVKQIDENGNIENSIQTTYPGPISQEVLNNYLDMFNFVEPDAYGGGVEGLKLDHDEWVGVFIADNRWNYHSTSENSAFKCIINALKNVIRNPKKGGKYKQTKKRRH
jgi:hypothetical protein